MLETKIDQGVLSVAHINVSSDAVAAEARSVILALPPAAGALALNEQSIAKMIVAAVDTGSRTPPPATPSPAAAPVSGIAPPIVPAA